MQPAWLAEVAFGSWLWGAQVPPRPLSQAQDRCGRRKCWSPEGCNLFKSPRPPGPTVLSPVSVRGRCRRGERHRAWAASQLTPSSGLWSHSSLLPDSNDAPCQAPSHRAAVRPAPSWPPRAGKETPVAFTSVTQPLFTFTGVGGPRGCGLSTPVSGQAPCDARAPRHQARASLLRPAANRGAYK